jgi:translation initiation factor eIF-2B subunit delta
MGMGNLIKFLRFAISRVPPEISEAEAKSLLISQLRSFLEERILFAREAIIQVCTDTIRDGDIILTYGSSPLLRQIFLSSAENKNFKLIIVDARPLNDGLLSLEVLSPSMQCVYVTLAGVTSALEDATKVIIGASALLANGAMVS